MKRSGPEPEDFVTPILVRVMDMSPEAKQGDLARALGCDHSRISHIKAGRQRLSAHELVTFCHVYGTYEPVDAMAARLGLEVTDKHAAAGAATLRRHVSALMRAVADLTLHFEDAAPGGIDSAEAVELDAMLVSIIEQAKGMRARLPRGLRGVA